MSGHSIFYSTAMITTILSLTASDLYAQSRHSPRELAGRLIREFDEDETRTLNADELAVALASRNDQCNQTQTGDEESEDTASEDTRATGMAARLIDRFDRIDDDALNQRELTAALMFLRRNRQESIPEQNPELITTASNRGIQPIEF